MPRFDLPLSELREYRPDVAEPADFDAFWTDTLAEARSHGEAPKVEPTESHLTEVDVSDVSFPGFGGDPIKAWFMTPSGRSGRLPTVVQYVGYSSGRGFPHESLAWVSAGYAHLIMDTRGQGSGAGSGGSTGDSHGSGPAGAGFTTRGIEDPARYYYRRVYTDAVRAIDAVRTFDRVDPDRVIVHGGSQGGGITLAVAGLVPDLVAVMPDVPFLSHFERAVGFIDRAPYDELVRYLAVHRTKQDEVFRTLSYFDGVNFAKRAHAPALYSVGLMDPVCPPSTVFASFNHYAGQAEIEIYPFNQHEGGGGYHWRRQVEWLAGILAGR